MMAADEKKKEQSKAKLLLSDSIFACTGVQKD
jgi:hypothetical protein